MLKHIPAPIREEEVVIASHLNARRYATYLSESQTSISLIKGTADCERPRDGRLSTLCRRRNLSKKNVRLSNFYKDN
jgi:hypothetical protein